MGIIESLIRFLSNLFDLRGPRHPDMKRRTSDEGDGPRVEVTLHSSLRLRNRNGLVSEEMAQRFIAHALREAGRSFEIRWNFDPHRMPDESPDPAFERWRDIVKEEMPDKAVAKDSNILLTYNEGGGLSFVRGNVAVAPGYYIDEERPWEPVGADRQHRNLHAVLHELGHSLGAQHDHDDDDEGKQHSGMGWNDHERRLWHRTPTVAGNGAPNRCGEMVEKREYERAARHQTFHSCMVENMHVRPMEQSNWNQNT